MYISQNSRLLQNWGVCVRKFMKRFQNYLSRITKAFFLEYENKFGDGGKRDFIDFTTRHLLPLVVKILVNNLAWKTRNKWPLPHL